MIRILIADDHAIFREGLKHILEEHPDIVVADEAGNGQEVLDKVWKNPYDMVLLDIGMPGMPAIEVLKQMKNERPRVPVLVLSMYPEDQYAVRFIRAGASGYLTKESAPDELITAIRKITAGKRRQLARRLRHGCLRPGLCRRDHGQSQERPVRAGRGHPGGGDRLGAGAVGEWAVGFSYTHRPPARPMST